MPGARIRPVHAALATDAMFKAIREQSSILDWRVHEDAGVARGFDPDDQLAVRAVRKGAKGQPWIVMYYNTPMVTWSMEPITDAKPNEEPSGLRGDLPQV